ncbi:MAG: hypothetical protein ACWA5W_03460, partial [Phycisphaerales bacterium]
MKMDLDNPAALLSGIIISSIGMGFLIFGKKNRDLGALLIELLLSVIPFVGHSLLVLWGVVGGCFGG